MQHAEKKDFIYNDWKKHQSKKKKSKEFEIFSDTDFAFKKDLPLSHPCRKLLMFLFIFDE